MQRDDRTYELSADLMTRFGWYYNLVMAMGWVMLGIVSMVFSLFADVGAFMASCFFSFGAIYLLRWRWSARLKHIEIAGDALYISDYLGRRDAVHLANVTDVAEAGGILALKKIQLILAADTRFGRIVEFLPQGGRRGPWRPHPMATYLQERIAAARVGIPPRLPAQQYAEQYLELQADMRRLRETEDQEHSRRMRRPG